MKTKVYFFLSLILIIVSCGSHKYRDNYFSKNVKDRSQCFYIVDTINIADPIIVKEKGGFFIVSQTSLENNPKRIRDLLCLSDVYILEFDEFFFYSFLSQKDRQRFLNTKLSFYSDTEQTTIRGKTYMKFKSPNVSFVLCLIKTNFYNSVMENACGDWYMIKNKEFKNSYYRIVFPILK